MQEVTLGSSSSSASPTSAPAAAQAAAPAIQSPSTRATSPKAVAPRRPTPFTIWLGKRLRSVTTNIRKFLSLGFVAVLAGLLSWTDGYFTLTALRSWIPPLANIATFQWLIHLAITALSIYLIPLGKNWAKLKKARKLWFESGEQDHYRKYARARKNFITCSLIWVVVVGFNVGTSSTGIYQLSSGAHIELFGGFTLPDGGGGWRVFCSVLGFIVGFSPEFLAHWVEDEWRNS